MAVPDYQTLMRPLLACLESGQTLSRKELRERVAQVLDLTTEDLAEQLSSGQSKFHNRVSWAGTYLLKAGLLERPSRGMYRISADGIRILAEHPDRIDNRVLATMPGFSDFAQPVQKPQNATSMPDDQRSSYRQTDESDERSKVLDETPSERATTAHADNERVVADSLTVQIQQLSPEGFERLVLRLLSAIGYGSSGAIVGTQASGDGGIDGIISQDPLGLDRIYVQAKRYAPDKAVGRPSIQGFAGALLGAQGDRGVFITTSRFTGEARSEAERTGARIELVDGQRLTELMVRHGVGVQVESTFTFHRVDEDFFDNL